MLAKFPIHYCHVKVTLKINYLSASPSLNIIGYHIRMIWCAIYLNQVTNIKALSLRLFNSLLSQMSFFSINLGFPPKLEQNFNKN